MHVVLPVLPPQAEQATRLLTRIADLGGVSQFPALIVSAGEIDLAPLHKLASSAFQGVSLLPIEIPEGHPNPASVLFARTAFHLGEVIGDAYLYLEPDSWPASTHWLKDLVSAYREYNARFMGKLAPLPPPDITGESYMLATGIYPKDFYAKSDLIRQLPLDKPAPEFLQGEIVYRGKAHDSGLFVLSATENPRNASLIIHYQVMDNGDDGEIEEDSITQEEAAAVADLIARDPVAAALFKAQCEDAYRYTMTPDPFLEQGPAVENAGAFRVETGPSEYISVKRDRERNALDTLTKTRLQSLDPSASDAMRADFANPSISTSELAARYGEWKWTVPSGEKLSSEAVTPDASWAHNPQAFDPNIEVPIPATALVPEAEIPAEMLKPGTLDTYPQPDPVVATVTEGSITHVVAPDSILPAEGFATEVERNVAIKKAQAGGMPWREMMSTFKLTPKVLKGVLNAV